MKRVAASHRDLFRDPSETAATVLNCRIPLVRQLGMECERSPILCLHQDPRRMRCILPVPFAPSQEAAHVGIFYKIEVPMESCARLVVDPDVDRCGLDMELEGINGGDG